jgi:mRNA interferase MazF
VVTRQELAQGQVWWASLAEPIGSAPGYRRPVVVVQGNRFNRSRIATVVVVPITRTLRLADQPGNVLLQGVGSGLPGDSVANVSQILTIDRSQLDELVSHLDDRLLDQILLGIQLLLER